MSRTLDQIFIANPITTNLSTDLLYFSRSPYTSGNDAGMTYANFAAQFGSAVTPSALTATPDTNVTITLGGTPATALLQASSITLGWTGQLSPARGGTGVNNGTSTFTVGGNFAMTGAFTFNGTLTANTAVTFPTSGTLATTSQIPTGAALTEVNDTNVTLTLGGSPSIALVNAASITAGWAGQLSLTRGGTNASLTASNGGIFYSNATSGAILAGTATAHQVLLSGASTTPLWSTATYPTTTTINQLLYSSAANTIGGVTTNTSAVLATTSAGVPTFSATMTNGQVIIGSTGATPTAATLTAGTNISITNGNGSITINSTASGAFTWTNVATSTQVLAINTGYITNNGATLVTYSLPATVAQGSVIRVSGFSAGGWTITQGASQEIFYGNQHTTIGTGGSLSSSNANDQVELLCVVANTSFEVLSSIGNLTVV
jgi:hypothetical protein